MTMVNDSIAYKSSANKRLLIFHFDPLFKKLTKKNLRRSNSFKTSNILFDENKVILLCSIKACSSFQ